MGAQGASAENFINACSPTAMMAIVTKPKAGETTLTRISTLAGASIAASMSLNSWLKKRAPVSVSSAIVSVAEVRPASWAAAPDRTVSTVNAGVGVGVGAGVAVGVGVGSAPQAAAHSSAAPKRPTANLRRRIGGRLTRLSPSGRGIRGAPHEEHRLAV